MATIDPTIALRVAPSVQLESPVNQLARVMQLQGLQQQNQLAQMQMDAQRTDRAQANQLMQFLGTNPDLSTPEGISGLYRAAPLKADGILKSRLDTKKAGTDAEAAAVKLATDRYSVYKKTLGALSAVPNLNKDMVIQAGQELVSAGILPPSMLQSALAGMPDDPNQIRMALRQGLAAQLTPEQVFTVFAPKPEKFDTGQQIVTRDMNPNSPTYGQNTGGAPFQKMATPGDVLSAETTRRGQNMVDARARERLEYDKSQPKGQFIQTEQGYVLADPRNGTVQPVAGPDGKPLMGKSATRNLTEGQAKANMFGSRMVEADRILSGLEGKYSPLAVNSRMAAERTPLVGGVLGAVGNVAMSKEGQQAEQAQRDFINAVLRRESGAVIADSEFDNARKQYFPQPGDSKEVLAQKARNRKTAIDGMAAEIPGGLRSVPTLQSPGGPSVGGFKILSVE